MSTTTLTFIDGLLENLKEADCAFISHSVPAVGSGVKEFKFDAEQFRTAQSITSGANLGPSVQDSVDYLVSRSQELHEEAESYEETTECGYNLPMGYCSYGYSIYEYEDNPHLVMWYETTRGTILCHCVDHKGDSEYGVYLPEERTGGYHNELLDMVSQGMSTQQWEYWYNCHCLEGKEEAYADYASWWNQHMVPLGYEPKMTGKQFQLEKKFDDALQQVYGSWAESYGIGEIIEEILGPPGELYKNGQPKHVLEGEQLGDRLLEIEKQLSKSLEKMVALRTSLGLKDAKKIPVGTPVEGDYEGADEYDDYDD